MSIFKALLIAALLIVHGHSKSLTGDTRDDTSGHAAGQGLGGSINTATSGSHGAGGDSAVASGGAHVTGCANGAGGASVSIGGGSNNAAGGGSGTSCGTGNTANSATGAGAGSSASATGDVDLTGFGSGFGEALVVNGRELGEELID